MPAMKPEDCDILIGKALNAADVDAIMELYESGACFVADPAADAVTGDSALREMFAGMVASKPKLTVEVTKVVQAGDIAITYSKWTATSTDADGKTQTDAGAGTEVVRRQADGTWRFLIDHPTGAMGG